ncbi:GDP-mannose 4,6-dehydratase [Ponticaulis sp.]|uniref:GDP-mannose 4,6-dehydratase n=1 Tax=Ponticaulis sp. TaxID=2020902 RepID=UPI000C5FB218|nr:GDP-mannose 4,6-dehydratase [Ponticaulis sp.]MAJ08319.1 hypothetical protein [Ponticaulis sp.]
MSRQKALIFGITGQDGAYLARRLLDLGFEVTGTCQNAQLSDKWRLQFVGICEQVRLVTCGLDNAKAVQQVVWETEPDWFFNLAGYTSLAEANVSRDKTLFVNGEIVGVMLDSATDAKDSVRFFQASSAQVFGNETTGPQTEETPVNPENFYAEAKVVADDIVADARSAGVFAVSGVLYNHESPLRTERFLSRKVTMGMVEAARNSEFVLRVGNLNSRRDWSYADDFMKAAVLSLQNKAPSRYILSSGQFHCVRDWIEIAAAYLGLDIRWQGDGVDEIAVDTKTGRTIVAVAPEFYRAQDPDGLIGNP